jgi:hypothetical protein
LIVPKISNLLQKVLLESYEHAGVTVAIVEGILDLLVLAAAFLLVSPPVGDHLEAAQAVE